MRWKPGNEKRMSMKPGLYEQIVDLVLAREVGGAEGLTRLEVLDASDSHDYLAQYMHRVLLQGLAQVQSAPDASTPKEKAASRVRRQVELCNEIIVALQRDGNESLADAAVSSDACRLMEVLNDATGRRCHPRPDTPLALGAILTGTRQDPSLVSQLQKEIPSSDRIDVLCSFIKWSGIRILSSALEAFTARPGSQLRVITTSYMGATDLKAAEFLRVLPNTEVKVSYDSHRTRLHAKAYLFSRATGFGCAYVGSANISHAALTDGLEWNVKISQYEQPFQWDKVAATFDTYWNDPEFVSYEGPDAKERLQAALAEQHTGGPETDGTFVLPNFDLRPYGFQQEILDRIAAERELQARRKHLIVAATGTGKTMIAAFDFKQWWNRRRAEGNQGVPRLLFVAHREEILQQSMYTFRAVLRDQNFGDIMVGGRRPACLDQLFISIQTYNSQQMASLVEAEHYDYVVVDEFHHAAAPSYQDLMSHVEPESLLGLTATPERADGLNIGSYFDDHITAEIRLPDAVNRKLLCPFQYFGISDSVDYSSLRWQRGGYVQAELENLLTGNDVRANLIIEKVGSTLLDVKAARGIGFCVSKQHAEYMSRKFEAAGIQSDFLTADSSPDHRHSVQGRLRNQEIKFIFVVDLYNEGVDIPEVDTVLFLRPTESLTVFLQQLGRGLRLSDGKDCLTVLDFVGQSHRKYRFDLRLGALSTDRTRRVKDEFEEGFPHLPAGCSIQFEEKARQYVLQNINQALIQNRPRIVQNIASFTADTGIPLSLPNFMQYHRLGIDEIYRRAIWARLCAQAGVRNEFSDPDEMRLTKGLRRIQHIDDRMHIERLTELLAPDHVADEDLSESDRRRLIMLHFSLWGSNGIPKTLKDGHDLLRSNPTLLGELLDLLALRRDMISTVSPKILLPFSCPLAVHAKYTRDEILVALGHWTLQRQTSMREGVLHFPDINTDAFFVTLNKAEKHYSPTTMYEDYAISDTLFHWQSQSTTSAESPTGQRYINHVSNGHTILLFVREDRKNANGLSEPYHFLGPATYVNHVGSRPISITWKLKCAMPARLLRETSRLVVA